MKFLTPILLFVLSVGLFFWYINPTYGSIQELKSELAVYEDALNQARAASAKRDDLVNRANAISNEDMARLEKMLPDKIDTIRMTVDIDNLVSTKYKTKVKNIRVVPGSESATAIYSTTQIGFSISLTYDNFIVFLKDLEKTLKLFDVSNISFTPTANGVYDFNINLKTYSLK